VSWAAHDFEPYALQKHLGGRVTMLPLYIGSLGPDMFTKWYVYGISLFGIEIKADDPAMFHRGWPGAGFTHTPLFAIVVALLVYAVSRHGVWAFSLGLGLFAHAATDILDTNGTMLLFPFTSERISLGAWAYAAEEGKHLDGFAYYSSLGLVADLAALALTLVSWRVLQRAYFEEHVLPNDPVMKLAGKVLPASGLLVLYRFGFVFGVTRLASWLIFAHVIHTNAFDLSWGGPDWVTPFG
jgi:membrane-bound metal-dependent hydrolase YbcI (DUF457 family)